jgi:N-acetylmuramoyl-L-alanine amidase
MKFGIDMGHNCPPKDIGAVGIEQEDKLTKDVGTRLSQKLVAAGHSVINCTPSKAATVTESLRKRVDKANTNAVDIFVSIHFNKAFSSIVDKPVGTEIYAVSNTGKAIARSVLNEIVKLGFKDRGIKNTGFFVIKNTSMPAILIECCFLDSRPDMKLFDAETMAEAIKVGLIGDADDTSTVEPATLKITQKTVLKPSTEQSSELPADTLISIDVGEFDVLDFRLEERHYWVKWPNKSQGNRDEHFIFEEHAEMLEK